MAQDGAMVAKISKKSHHVDHKNITYRCAMYRDDSVADGTLRVMVNGKQIEANDGVVAIPYSHEAFKNAGTIDIKVYM